MTLRKFLKHSTSSHVCLSRSAKLGSFQLFVNRKSKALRLHDPTGNGMVPIYLVKSHVDSFLDVFQKCVPCRRQVSDS